MAAVDGEVGLLLLKPSRRADMVNEKHLKLQGVMTWNAWREANPGVEPNLLGADLSRANLRGVDLNKADLGGAKLFRAVLSRAKLFRADSGHRPLDRRGRRVPQNPGHQIAHLIKAVLDREHIAIDQLDRRPRTGGAMDRT